jgi:3-phenylpropionate/trans-cinnamate dioxygenase ferredoxin subunit
MVSVTHREETKMTDSTSTPTRLVAVEDLDERQVTVVETAAHGALAVGLSAGKPFAVSNRCRHLFASLGAGRVTEDGCLQCPSHAALYDVSTGAMTRGPQGAFRPLAGLVKGTTGARALKTFPVTLRDGAIWLEG